ncbi:hypothetical protein LTR78_009051 [Recurvomyces mirabilis]|uniref:Conserved oligomeric Golgi complex subunit 1 n=1 Tax=Recurvomyces mirabilis TaxID=574656 RepID=A0AAE0TQ20_9PEZI|nr:hypothetical protein LTR78_009051 [Recurvomyces mirabilis]KAK5150421.1 hypothetical protein LTS14_010111 [Recurvomyces mirabilis]
MAGQQPPDPRTLDTWENAFQYPLPIVRKMELQLRRNIEENRQKLRTLVGASYRDLLGTAERIIEMDGQMRGVEGELGEVGRRCDGGRIERIGVNFGRLRGVGLREGRERERGGLRAVAQTKVLQSCLVVARRIMRRGGGEALVVAKVLVLGRLLCKSVEEGGEKPAVLEELRRRLGLLRKRLVAYIDRSLLKTSTVGNDGLAQSLAAYALVTSSSAKDVLRHFLNIHLERIESEAEGENTSKSAILEVLDFYKQTLESSRAVFPRAFMEAVARLSKGPLLRDPQITALTELNIDLYGDWVAEEVQSFTPWLRHESLATSEVQAALKSWSMEAQKMLLTAVTTCIDVQKDFSAVVEVRRAVVLRYMAMASLHNDEHVSDTIREVAAVTRRRLGEIAKRTVHAGSDSFSGLRNDSASHQATSDIWNLASQDFDLHAGAKSFRTAILAKQHGRGHELQVICRKLDGWVEDIEALVQSVQQLRTVRWHSELDVDLDDLEDSDALVDELNKDDPDKLLAQLRKGVGEVLKKLYDGICDAAQSVDDPATILRALRELKRRESALHDLVDVDVGDDEGTAQLISSLHHALAVQVSKEALALWSSEHGRHHNVATTLWDGSPVLPVQISPTAFKVLTNLHGSMADVGHDLWSARAVDALKRHLDKELAISLGDALPPRTSLPTTTKNGHAYEEELSSNGGVTTTVDHETKAAGVEATETNDEQSVRSREDQIQSLFDILYIGRILHRPETTSQKNEEKKESLHNQASELFTHLDLEHSARERLTKSANEYWKRTYLLFGFAGR